MKEKILKIVDNIFDILYNRIESIKSFKIISTSLVVIFISSLFLIFLNNIFELPEFISKQFSHNYFFAVETVFMLLLAVEIIEMVLVLPQSITDSIAKQFEIFSLILLRQGFKEFSHIELPIELESAIEPASHLLSDIFGALFIFAGVLVFTKMQKHRKITKNNIENKRFISAKKGLALVMIAAFIGIGFYDVYLFINHNETFQFFSMFYSVLIFSDILIVIISLRYSHLYCVVFRNTGFALATILIRFALSLPHYYDAAMGIIAMVFVIGISFIYNRFMKKLEKENELITKEVITCIT